MNQLQIRSDQAIAEGWKWNDEPPEPKTCEYCGRTLYHFGIISPVRKKQIFIWMKEPEHCDCAEAQSLLGKGRRRENSCRRSKRSVRKKRSSCSAKLTG
jgi:hypothetical protein